MQCTLQFIFNINLLHPKIKNKKDKEGEKNMSLILQFDLKKKKELLIKPAMDICLQTLPDHWFIWLCIFLKNAHLKSQSSAVSVSPGAGLLRPFSGFSGSAEGHHVNWFSPQWPLQSDWHRSCLPTHLIRVLGKWQQPVSDYRGVFNNENTAPPSSRQR